MFRLNKTCNYTWLSNYTTISIPFSSKDPDHCQKSNTSSFLHVLCSSAWFRLRQTIVWCLGQAGKWADINTAPEKKSWCSIESKHHKEIACNYFWIVNRLIKVIIIWYINLRIINSWNSKLIAPWWRYRGTMVTLSWRHGGVDKF